MAGKVSSGGGGKRDTQPVTDPNVIPFIDIMLVLLIIFMVTAPIPTVDVRVDLPPRNPKAEIVQDQRPTFVRLQDVGGQLILTVDEQPTTLTTLADKVLEQAIYNNPGIHPVDIFADAKIYVRADQNTAYGNVIGVMSRLKEEGFAQVGIFAERAQAQL